jgi:hypothetical protein
MEVNEEWTTSLLCTSYMQVGLCDESADSHGTCRTQAMSQCRVRGEPISTCQGFRSRPDLHAGSVSEDELNVLRNWHKITSRVAIPRGLHTMGSHAIYCCWTARYAHVLTIPDVESCFLVEPTTDVSQGRRTVRDQGPHAHYSGCLGWAGSHSTNGPRPVSIHIIHHPLVPTQPDASRYRSPRLF